MGSFSGVAKDQGLNLILNFFFGPAINAARGLAYQVSGAVQSFVINITTAARPQMMQAYSQGNVQRSLQIMYSMSKISYISVFIFALPLILEIDYILHLWLGTEIPNHTNSFIILVVASSLINVFNPPISFVVHATGKMKLYQLVTSLFSLSLLPISYFFLYRDYAPEIVFVLHFIFTAIGQLLSLLILKKLIPFSLRSYLYFVIIPSVITTLLSMFIPLIVCLIMDSSFFRLILVISLSLISVTLFSYLVELDYRERRIVKEFVREVYLKYFK